nr:RNA-directed DNA polymerase, eukaryota, reverse transcriptase zinc-binding domain protein [Tanacetum cinerariifolium]
MAMLWILLSHSRGRLKFHANIARFLRPPLNDKNPHANKDAGNKRSGNDVGANADSKPVKEFASLSNLRSALINEGFVDFKIRYMDTSLDFNADGRIAWIEIEGVPFKLGSNNTFKIIAAKWEELLDIDDQKDAYFHSKRICLITKSDKNISENFKIIFQGKIFWIRANEVPGWVPKWEVRWLDHMHGRRSSISSSFWARIIKAIHGVEGKIGMNFMACKHSCWLSIVKEISNLKNQGINFMDFMGLKLGNGNNISFWADHWIDDDSLKVLYPRLYALENSNHVSVSMKLADVKLDNSFRRMPRGRIEHAQFTELSERVSDVILLPISDRWIWSLEGSGEFTVASIRREIDDKRLSGVTSKTRWIKSVPIKVNVHAWKVKLDALPTRLNISRRGVVIDSIL